MGKLKQTLDRPVLIKVICILGFLSIVMSVYWIMNPPEENYDAMPLYWTISSELLIFTSLIGIWRMRKWGANLFTVVSIINVAGLALTHRDFLFLLVVSAVIIFILLTNYSRMK